MNAQTDAVARLKDALAKLGLMDEVAYQANRQKLAEDLGCELGFLDKSWKRGRAARLRALNRSAGARSPQQVNVVELLSKYDGRYEVETHPDRKIFSLAHCGFVFEHHAARIVQRTDDATVMPVYKCPDCPEKTFRDWRLAYDPEFEERERAATAKLKNANQADVWTVPPFHPLGVRGTDLVVYCPATKQVLTGSGRAFLLYVGNYEFFHSFAATGKDGERIDWDVAQSQTIEQAKRGGLFDTSRVRSRGAWTEQEDGRIRLVLNLGDRLLVNGEPQPLGPRAGYIYTAGVALKIPRTLPPHLTTEGAEPIRKLFATLRWRSPHIDPLLLRGFIVAAQVGGALTWRPNLWLTSRSQAGKTTLRERGIRPLTPFFFGTFGVDSSAAGIRQKLAGDSLPWCFDESEADTVFAQSQIKGVLRLLRGASSSTDEEFSVKGTTHGRPLSFGLRSSALLSSVLVASEAAADTSRITPVELVASPEKEFREVVEPLFKPITPQLGLQLFSRIVRRWRDLFDYIELFKPRVTSRVGSMRGGDQLGTLLAGAFFLEHDGTASEDDVDKFLDNIKDWGEHGRGDRVAGGEGTDEQRCFTAILTAQLDVAVDGEPLWSRDGELSTRVRSTRDKRTIAELIDIARSGEGEGGVALDYAQDLLGRFGIRVELEGDQHRIWIANQNDGLRRALNWQFTASAWRMLLARLPGATRNPQPKKFAGVNSRFVSLPATLLDADITDDEREAEIDRLVAADKESAEVIA